VLGKHTKRIKCGCWSKQNLLALASDDRSLSVSNSDGDTLRQFSLQGDPSDLQFSEMKADERSNIGENTASSVGDNSIGLAAAAALSWLLSSLSTHADRQGVDISFTVCFCVCVCTVTDFSAEDKDSSVTFCSAVRRRQGRKSQIFVNFAPPPTVHQ